MIKYKVKIHTLCPDLVPVFEMDEFELADFLDFGDSYFVEIEDDTHNTSIMVAIDSIVGIEWREILKN